MADELREDDMSDNIDGERLRKAMRLVPSPVTVVTTGDANGPRGITIGSFNSVSLDPPLISFNLNREAQMYPVAVAASRFAVHLLGDDQAFLSNHFAIPDLSSEEQFAGMVYRDDDYGVPILEDVLVVFHCTLFAVYEAGDHSIFVGEVVGIEEGKRGKPLLYYDRTYRSVGDELKSTFVIPTKRVSSDTP